MDKADEQFYKIQAILQQNCIPPVVMLYFRYRIVFSLVKNTNLLRFGRTCH